MSPPAQCGEEPHNDPASEAVAWGSPENRVSSAAECCDRCASTRPIRALEAAVQLVGLLLHAAVLVLDNGNTHTFGECWLKFG